MKNDRLTIITLCLLGIAGMLAQNLPVPAEEPVTPTGQSGKEPSPEKAAESPKAKPVDVTQPISPTKQVKIIIVPMLPEDIINYFETGREPGVRVIDDTSFGIIYLEKRSAEKEAVRAQIQGENPENRNQPTISVHAKEQTTSEIEKTITTALRLFKENKFDKAAAGLKQFLLKKNDNPVVLIIYGHSLFAQGYYKLATHSLRKGIKLIKDFQNTPMDLQEFYDKPETMQKQLEDLISWVKYNPADLDAQFLLGYVYFFTNQYEKSIPAFQNLKEKKYTEPSLDAFIRKGKELSEKKESPTTNETPPTPETPALPPKDK